MRILSDITGKEYKTVEECKKAEEIFTKEKQKKETAMQNEKKMLAGKIEEADKKLKAANEYYDAAKAKAKDLLEKTNKQVREILGDAENQLKAAENAKYNAIIEFNKKYGAYKTEYTGEKAVEEFNKAMRLFEDPVIDFFRALGF